MVAAARMMRKAAGEPARTSELQKNLDAVVKKLAGNSSHIRYEIQKYHPLGASAMVQMTPEGVALVTLFEFVKFGERTPAQIEGALAHEIVHSGLWMMMDPKRRARVRRLTPQYMADGGRPGAGGGVPARRRNVGESGGKSRRRRRKRGFFHNGRRQRRRGGLCIRD